MLPMSCLVCRTTCSGSLLSPRPARAQLSILREGAAPVRHALRPAYLRAVVAALPRDGEPLTNGALQEAVAVAQRQVLALAIGRKRRARDDG
jgi:hypothetical protein